MRLILPLLVLAGCGPQARVMCQTMCGLSIATQQTQRFSCEEYRLVEEAALADAHMPPSACQTFRGATAWELPGDMSTLGGIKVAGWTECHLRRLFFHTGLLEDNRRLWNTAFVHELIHLAQHCAAPLPIDPGADEQHANWMREKLYDMGSRVGARLEGK